MYYELSKWEQVNACKTPEELFAVMRKIAEAGTIIGRTSEFDVEKMINAGRSYFKGESLPNVFTRSYGIRQQAMHISFYYKC